MRNDVAGETWVASICFDRPHQTGSRWSRHQFLIGPAVAGDGKSSFEMTDDVKRHWFVVAVFRDPLDLAAMIGDLHASNFASGELLVLANYRVGDVRKAIQARNGGFIEVIAPRANGGIGRSDRPALPRSLSTLLRAMGEGATSASSPSGSDDEKASSPVYAQLIKDVADGAVVLIASATGPEQQLRGARILLRGNCECVLTHELRERGI